MTPPTHYIVVVTSLAEIVKFVVQSSIARLYNKTRRELGTTCEGTYMMRVIYAV